MLALCKSTVPGPATSSERTLQPCMGEACTWFTQKYAVSPTPPTKTGSESVHSHGASCSRSPSASAIQSCRETCCAKNKKKAPKWDRRTVIIERVWHERSGKCLEWRTLSNESYQLKSQGTVFTFPLGGQTLGARHKWVKVEAKTKVSRLAVEVRRS